MNETPEHVSMLRFLLAVRELAAFCLAVVVAGSFLPMLFRHDWWMALALAALVVLATRTVGMWTVCKADKRLAVLYGLPDVDPPGA